MGSHSREQRIGMMRSCLCTLIRILPAQFCTCCSLWMYLPGIPMRGAWQSSPDAFWMRFFGWILTIFLRWINGGFTDVIDVWLKWWDESQITLQDWWLIWKMEFPDQKIINLLWWNVVMKEFGWLLFLNCLDEEHSVSSILFSHPDRQWV